MFYKLMNGSFIVLKIKIFGMLQVTKSSMKYFILRFTELQRQITTKSLCY